jgi:hypothetical protein
MDFSVAGDTADNWKRRGKKLVAEQDDVENTTGSMLEFQAYSCEVTH